MPHIWLVPISDKQVRAGKLFGGTDWGDLGYKARPAFEGDIAPQPSYGDNETVPKANEKIDVHRAPKHPAN